MISTIRDNDSAVIVLHEIYGVNPFIEEVCRQYVREDCDVFCPELLGDGVVFSYDETEKAYAFFMENAGFEMSYKEVGALADRLKSSYRRVLIAGFSVGATVAWRCSERGSVNGVICCYGSRIRDYLETTPGCPTLLAFADRDSFDVDAVCAKLRKKPLARVEIFEGEHGFLDSYSGRFHTREADRFHAVRKAFLTGLR